MTAKRLAEMLRVTERTIYRDIADLNRLGYCIYSADGYRIDHHYSTIKLPFSSDDMALLRMMIDSSPLRRLPHMRTRCNTLMEKLQAMVALDDSNEFSIESAESSSPFQVQFDFKQLEHAIEQRRVIRVNYHALQEEAPVQRVFHPYVITLRSGSWYLIAFSPDRNDYRFLRLERMRSMELLQETFERDPSFSVQSMFQRSFNVFRGEPTQCTVEMKGAAARLARERNWPEGISIQQDDGKRIVLSITASGEPEIVNWVLGFGEEAWILEPKELRDAVRARLERALENYKVG